MLLPTATLQHFSLIAQSNSAVLNILINVRFFVSSNVFLCNSDDMHQFMVLVLI